MQHDTCIIRGCEKPRMGREWCFMHYKRWQIHGDPMIVLPPNGGQRPGDPIERFWGKVDKAGLVPVHRPELGSCWMWIESCQKGYGSFYLNGRKVGAHRFAYELLVGPVPDGLELDHLCHNDSGCAGGPCVHRRCVNPSHLEPVSHRENMIRGATFIAPNLAKTHCVNGHEFTSENTYTWHGTRQCRTCHRTRQRARYANRATR